MIKRIIKLIAWITIIIVLLLSSAYTLIQFPRVQTFLAARITSYLSDQLHTQVEIKGVKIEFFKKLVLRGVYIEDLHQDTLLYAKSIKVDISIFRYKKQELTIRNMELQHAIIGLKRYKEDDDLNIVKLLEQIKASEKDTTTASWKIKIDKIRMVENNFTYRDLRWDDYTPCIDFEDVDVSHLNADLENIEFIGDSIFFNARNISLFEKKGFTLKHLTAEAKIAPDEMRFTNLVVETTGSKLDGHLTFSYNEFADFTEFIQKVRFTSGFNNSLLDSRDLAFFAKELIGLNKKIVFSGKIKGTVDNIKGRKMEIACLDHTFFKGDISLRGLPDVEETSIDLLVDQLITNSSDICKIPAYPFYEPGNIVLPANLESLGIVRFKGKFTGFYNDFVAYGNLNTAIGYISSDINLKFDKNFNKSSYSGNLSASDFNAGKLLLIDQYLGNVTGKVRIAGTGFSMNKVNAELNGNISEMAVHGYHYKNIRLNGKLAKKLFSGDLAISDENVDLNFNGKVDFNGTLPEFNFHASLSNARLARLNLSQRDTGSVFGCEAFFNFKGNNIDNITGNLLLRNISYMERGIPYLANNISLKSEVVGTRKNFVLESDMLDATVQGEFRLSSAIESFQAMLGKYFPALPSPKITVNEPQSFSYLLNFKKTQDICQLFIPELYIEEGTTFFGKFNSTYEDLNFNLNSRHLSYKFIDLKSISLAGLTQQAQIKIDTHVGELFIHDSLRLNDLNVSLKTNRDSAFLELLLADVDSLPNSLNLKARASFLNQGITHVHIQPSLIKLDYKKWEIDSSNLLVLDSTGFQFHRINFVSENQGVQVSGVLSSKETDAMVINLTDFKTSVLNKVLKIYNIELGGTATGFVQMNAVTGKMTLASDMHVTNFAFFNDTLGDATAKASWNTGSRIIDIDGHIDRNEFKNLVVKGHYYLKEINDSMAFDIQMHKFPVQTFNHFMDGVASNLTGLLNLDLKLYGNAKEPLVAGSGDFQKTSFTIDYLNTRYSFADEFTIDNNQISFKNITLNDQSGNTAILDGSIYHQNLSHFFFNLMIQARNFELLNTSAVQNDLFYGKAYASGIVKISGDLNFISMDISLKSEKGTVINMPLSNPVEIKNKEFITFVSHKGINMIPEKQKINLNGIDMAFDLDITPDAEIKLIFDEKIGDVIIGRGLGNINMEIDPLGSFNIYGNYEISSGNYLFTLQNLINKDFKIEKGGTIRWNGDPFNAQINIEAVYRLNAVLNDLIQDTSSNNYNKRYPVELHLNLSENLFNPKIGFRVYIPDLDPTTETVVTRYLKTEEDINTQVFSLLLARRFSKPRDLQNSPNVSSSSNPVGENAAELLSSQVSNWISQISTDFDLGVNYRPGNQVAKDEFEVMVSTSILNNRVSIDGNVGVANNNQNSSSLVGDFNIEYKVSPDGRFRVKAFNKSNNNSLINANNSLYTQGIGVFYRREFDSWVEILDRIRKIFKKKKVSEVENS